MNDELTLADELREVGYTTPKLTECRMDVLSDVERAIVEESADRIAELEARAMQAVAELDGEHRPQWVQPYHGYTDEPVEGREPVGCVMCYPHDSDWPCASRMIADELRGTDE